MDSSLIGKYFVVWVYRECLRVPSEGQTKERFLLIYFTHVSLPGLILDMCP